MNKLLTIQKYLTKKEKDAVDKFMTAIKARFKTRLLIIKMIGSKVKGNFDAASDIDLFILVKKCDYSVMHTISEIAAKINVRYDVVVSPIVYSAKEHSRNVYFNNLFTQELDKNGVLLYEAA